MKSKINSSGKKLGLWSCVFMLISGMFGSAIFSLSGITIYEAGPSCLISWFAAAALMLIYGLLMAELAGYFPKSGGVYVFPSKAFTGKKAKFWGWVACWGHIIGLFAAISFSAIYVGQYLSVTFPQFSGYQVPIALLSVFLVFLINIIRFYKSSIINTILLIFLVAITITFVFFAITNQEANIENLVPFFGQGNSGIFGFLPMIPTAIVAYSSVVAIAFMASEVENPKRNIPLSCAIAIGITAVLYFLIIFSCLLYVSPDFINSHSNMKMLPLFAACNQMLSAQWLTPLIGIAAVLSLITTMVVLLAMSSRALPAVSSDGILPRFFSYKSKKGQPLIAIIAVTLVCSALVCFPGFVNEIINLGIIFSVTTIAIVLISVLFARKRFAIKDSIKLKGGNFWPIFLFCVIVLCNISGFLTSNLLHVFIYTLVLFGICVSIYVIWYFRSKKADNN